MNKPDAEIISYISIRDDAPFRAKLWWCMLINGLTAIELAKKLFITPTTVYYWITGKSTPRLWVAEMLAKTLGVSMDWLYREVDSSEESEEKDADGRRAD